MAGAASWSFSENDFKQIQQHLQAFLRDSNARCALLVDRTGQLVATVGDPPQFDSAAFASLTAADFSANDQLTTLGLVEVKGKGAVEHLNRVLEAMFKRVGTGPAASEKGLLEGAEDEIDKLFG